LFYQLVPGVDPLACTEGLFYGLLKSAMRVYGLLHGFKDADMRAAGDKAARKAAVQMKMGLLRMELLDED
jgi:hypothetical protein